MDVECNIHNNLPIKGEKQTKNKKHDFSFWKKKKYYIVCKITEKLKVKHGVENWGHQGSA